MNSATAAALLVEPNSSAAPTVDTECLRDILIRRPVSIRNCQPHRSSASNPVIAELMNTVVQARDRKRQREEALFNRRDVGQQTVREEGEVTVERQFESLDCISATKRSRRDDEAPREDRQYVDSGTSIEDGDLPAPTSPIPHSSSNSASTSASNHSSILAAHDRIAQRIQRRAQRTRRIQQAETMRLQMEHSYNSPYLQQINGIIPNEHTCNSRCRHHPPATGPNAVSPTVAPHMHLRHPLQPAFHLPYATYPLMSTTTQIVPAVMMSLPTLVPVPAASVPIATAPTHFQNIYGLAPSVTLSPLPTTDYFASFLRSHQEMMLPSFERMGLDRHHMFAGLDLDVPIGASRLEIDNFTKSEAYKKTGEDEETCTVCLSNFEDDEKIRKLPCNHFFHSECIDKWLDINKRCPMCRDEIDRNRVAA